MPDQTERMLRTPAEEAELTGLLRDWDRITARIRELGVPVKRRPGEISMAEWDAGVDQDDPAITPALECRADEHGHRWPSGKEPGDLILGEYEVCARCGAARIREAGGVLTYNPLAWP